MVSLASRRCAVPAPGCDCSIEGEQVPCGESLDKGESGASPTTRASPKTEQGGKDTITCAVGTMRCGDGKWGACGATSVVTKKKPSNSAIHTLGLGTAGACAELCSPFCSTITDNGIDLDAGSEFIADDAGLRLAPVALNPSLQATGGNGGVACDCMVISAQGGLGSVGVPLCLSDGDPWTVAFTAELQPPGCSTLGLKPLWSVENSFDWATISDDGVLTVLAPEAGLVHVRAYLGTVASNIATVNVTVPQRVSVSATQPPAAAITAASFPPMTGGTPVDPIQILYPYDGTVFPLGLPPPIVQWGPAPTGLGVGSLDRADGVQITLRYPAIGTAIFKTSQILGELTTEPFPNPVLPPKERAQISALDWGAFERTVARNIDTYGDTGSIILRRVVAGQARAEVQVSVRFAPEYLRSRLVYRTYGTGLSVNSNTVAIQSPGGAFPNGRFGASVAQLLLGRTSPTLLSGADGPANGAGCRGCHSGAASGSKVIVSDYGVSSNPFFPWLVSVNSSSIDQVRYASSASLIHAGIHSSATLAFSSAGALWGPWKNVAEDSVSRIYDVATGSAAVSVTQPASLKAGFPAFSHETTGPSQVAFTFVNGSPSPLANPAFGPTTGDGKTLSMMAFNGVGALSGFRNLFTPGAIAGKAGYSGGAWWPSFLPVGQDGLVFQNSLDFAKYDVSATPGAADVDWSVGNVAPGSTIRTASEIWWVNSSAEVPAQPTRLNKLNGYGVDSSNALPLLPNTLTGVLTEEQRITRHVGPGTDAVWSDPMWFEQHYNYEPSVLPQTRGGYSWVVFTSRRLYGNIATGDPFASDPSRYDISIQPTTKKLWMSAITSGAAPGTDPSAPAFYVPGQELFAANSHAQLLPDTCHPAGGKALVNECNTDADCCSGSLCTIERPVSFPAKRYCVTPSSPVCRGDGEACTSEADCCDASPNSGTGGRCVSGICKVPTMYASRAYERVYTATCAGNSRVVWSAFRWKSIIPPGASIDFSVAAPANAQASTWKTPVALASATATSADWSTGPATIGSVLASEPLSSEASVKVVAMFNVNAQAPYATPTLLEWRASYDCIPYE